MRSRRLGLVVTSALLAVGLGGAAHADGVTRHQCRGQWSDLVSLHGENGNPEGPVPELTARWDADLAAAESYADHATASDCGALIATYTLQWGALESFMYRLHRYDPVGRLAIAEGDRRHALQFQHVKHLSPRLEHLFDIARRQAPLAAVDLAPAMATVPNVEVTDRTEVRSTLAQLRTLYRASTHQRKLNRALRVITDAELDEE